MVSDWLKGQVRLVSVWFCNTVTKKQQHPSLASTTICDCKNTPRDSGATLSKPMLLALMSRLFMESMRGAVDH